MWDTCSSQVVAVVLSQMFLVAVVVAVECLPILG
jgi:hypothetical protein